jgi:hypothetical protein
MLELMPNVCDNLQQLPPTPDTLHLVFGKRAFIRYHISPIGEISWFVTFPQAKEPGREEVNEIGSDEWRQRMLDVLRDLVKQDLLCLVITGR